MERKYKDSGISWVGAIPSYWSVLRNKNAFICGKDLIGKLSSSTQLLSLTTKGIRAIKIGDTSGKVPDSYDTYQVVKPDNIVMCLFDLDCSAVFSGISKFDGMISPAYKVLSCKDSIIPQYADYWFIYVFDGRKFMHYSKNIRYSLTYDEFSALKIIAPPIAEQQHIADYLDKKCGEIDSLIALQEQMIEKLKAYKQSVITEAVTKGLNPNAKLVPSGIDWIGEIPCHWMVLPHKQIMHKIKEINETYRGENVISLSMQGVIIRDLNGGGKMPTSFDGYQFVYPGNLLMCLFDIDVTPRCIGIIKDYGVTSPAYSQFVLHNQQAYAPYYYYLLLSIDDAKAITHLSKNLRSSLTAEDFGAIKTILPPINEQKDIVSYLDSKCDNIDRLITLKQQKIESLKNYKKSVIYEAVTGKTIIE